MGGKTSQTYGNRKEIKEGSQMELKGYWTSYGYMGRLEDGTYMEFASDADYIEYMKGEND